MNEELLAAVIGLLAALASLAVKWAKSKDADKHGDQFLVMLRGAGDTFAKIGGVLPQIQPYVDEYNNLVAEAEKVWNSGGFTADDIRFIGREAALYKLQIDAIVAKYRQLKQDVSTGAVSQSKG